MPSVGDGSGPRTPLTALTTEEGAGIEFGFLTASYTGLRVGEPAALRVGQLDMLRRTLRVDEALKEERRAVTFGPPKTDAARRTVALPSFIVEHLAALIAADPALGSRRSETRLANRAGSTTCASLTRRCSSPSENTQS